MKKIVLMGAALATLSVAACHREPRYYAQQQMAQNGGYGDPCMNSNNPQQCAQVRDAGGNPNDYMMYGMGGYMLGSYMTPYGPRSYMYPNPAYHGAFHPIGSYAGSRAYTSRPGYRPYSAVNRITPSSYPVTRTTVTTTTSAPTKGGLFGGLRRSASATTTTRTTTTAPAYSSRPSYSSSSSYSSRPSYSSSSSSSYRSSSSSFSSSSRR